MLPENSKIQGLTFSSAQPGGRCAGQATLGLPPINRLWVLPPTHVTELDWLPTPGDWTLASALPQSAACWWLREQVRPHLGPLMLRLWLWNKKGKESLRVGKEGTKVPGNPGAHLWLFCMKFRVKSTVVFRGVRLSKTCRWPSMTQPQPRFLEGTERVSRLLPAGQLRLDAHTRARPLSIGRPLKHRMPSSVLEGSICRDHSQTSRWASLSGFGDFSLKQRGQAGTARGGARPGCQQARDSETRFPENGDPQQAEFAT